MKNTTLGLLPLCYLTPVCPVLSQPIALALLVSLAESIPQWSLKLLSQGKSQ